MNLLCSASIRVSTVFKLMVNFSPRHNKQITILSFSTNWQIRCFREETLQAPPGFPLHPGTSTVLGWSQKCYLFDRLIIDFWTEWLKLGTFIGTETKCFPRLFKTKRQSKIDMYVDHRDHHLMTIIVKILFIIGGI